MKFIGWTDHGISRFVAYDINWEAALNRGGKELAHSRKGLCFLHSRTINITLKLGPIPLPPVRAEEIPHIIFSRRQSRRNQPALNRDPVKKVLVGNNRVVEINTENEPAHLTFNC